MNATDLGFSIHSSLLSPIECERLVASLAGTVRSRAGARHLMRHPAVMTIAADPRLLDLAREWVGPDAVPYRATLFDKSASSNWLVSWHQDTALPLRVRSDDPRWGSWSTKAGIIYAQHLLPSWSGLSRYAFTSTHRPEKTVRCASCQAATFAAFSRMRRSGISWHQSLPPSASPISGASSGCVRSSFMRRRRR
jgi:hypothetical protein